MNKQGTHTRFNENSVKWNELKKIGISRNEMENRRDLKRLLNGEETGFYKVRINFAGEEQEFDVTLRLTEIPGGKPQLILKGYEPDTEPEDDLPFN